MLLIDEAHLLDRETVAVIARVAQWSGWDPSASSRGGLFLVLSGLPEIQRVLAESASYSERFRYERIGNLSQEDAAYAITEPLRLSGVAYEPEVIGPLVEMIGGYPHFTQIVGYHLWNYTTGLTVCVSDLLTVLSETRTYIREGLYASRLARVSERERDLLFAMSVDEGVSSRVRDLAGRLGKKDVRGISSVRESLVGKGILCSPKPGVLAFTVPGFGEYLRDIGE